MSSDRDDDGDDTQDGGAAAVSIPELKAIEEAALLAKSNRAVTFLAPPDLVLRLVRSHHATSVGALTQGIEASDVEAGLAERIESLKSALVAITKLDPSEEAFPGRQALRRAGALARKALRSDDLADQEMKAEFGFGVADCSVYELPERYYEDLPEPQVGEVWQDVLGAEYRVTEYDEDSHSVRLDVVRPLPEWVEASDLSTHGRRIGLAGHQRHEKAGDEDREP